MELAWLTSGDITIEIREVWLVVLSESKLLRLCTFDVTTIKVHACAALRIEAACVCANVVSTR